MADQPDTMFLQDFLCFLKSLRLRALHLLPRDFSPEPQAAHHSLDPYEVDTQELKPFTLEAKPEHVKIKVDPCPYVGTKPFEGNQQMYDC